MCACGVGWGGWGGGGGGGGGGVMRNLALYWLKNHEHTVARIVIYMEFKYAALITPEVRAG